MKKPSHLAFNVTKKRKILAKTQDFEHGFSKQSKSSISGQFELSDDGRFFEGFIDIGDDRLNCVLLPQEDPSILKLEEYTLEAPMGTGRVFRIM